MVADVGELQRQEDILQRKGLVIELVGVAGVGKTTLFRTLNNKDQPQLIEEYVPQVWTLSAAPFYIKNILLLFPTLIRVSLNGSRLLRRRELAFMAILNGWNEVLCQKVNNNDRIIVLDQGPISIIGDLLIWGPQSLREDNMIGWWEEIYKKCSLTLDMIFLLDTDNDTIMQRIRTRQQDHFLKSSSDQFTRQWTVRYRLFYEHIIARLHSYKSELRVIRIDSGRNTVDDIVKIFMDEVKKVVPEANE